MPKQTDRTHVPTLKPVRIKYVTHAGAVGVDGPELPRNYALAWAVGRHSIRMCANKVDVCFRINSNAHR